MLPEERRWKWVKKENLPDDLQELMDKLSKKKGKGEKKEKDTAAKTKVEETDQDGLTSSEYVTTVKTRNDLYVDYS